MRRPLVRPEWLAGGPCCASCSCGPQPGRDTLLCECEGHSLEVLLESVRIPLCFLSFEPSFEPFSYLVLYTHISPRICDAIPRSPCVEKQLRDIAEKAYVASRSSVASMTLVEEDAKRASNEGLCIVFVRCLYQQFLALAAAQFFPPNERSAPFLP